VIFVTPKSNPPEHPLRYVPHPTESVRSALPKTIEALRLTLAKLEHTTTMDQGADHIDRLKSRVIRRIAELEASKALDAVCVEMATASVDSAASVDTATVPVVAAAQPVEPTEADPDESGPKLKLAS